MIKTAYNKINIVFIFLILSIFIYSYIFTPEKNNYPIHSACKIKPCKSTGLSRAFSKIVRFEFDKAKEFNKYSIQVFGFFIIQFFFRFLTIFVVKKKLFRLNFVIIFDVAFSIILYLISFRNIIF